jgi:hypothetical protein
MGATKLVAVLHILKLSTLHRSGDIFLEVKFPTTVNHFFCHRYHKGNRRKCLFLCALRLFYKMYFIEVGFKTKFGRNI